MLFVSSHILITSNSHLSEWVLEDRPLMSLFSWVVTFMFLQNDKDLKVIQFALGINSVWLWKMSQLILDKCSPPDTNSQLTGKDPDARKD